MTPPDTTQTALSCRIWRAVWIGHYTVFTLYNWLYEHSQLYNQLDELCKWAQPSGAWAVQPGCYWRHYVDAQQGDCVDSRRCACSLEKSDTFDKQLEVKATDTFGFMHTHNIVNTCDIHWWIGVRKVHTASDIQGHWYRCHLTWNMYRFWDISTYFPKFSEISDP